MWFAFATRPRTGGRVPSSTRLRLHARGLSWALTIAVAFFWASVTGKLFGEPAEVVPGAEEIDAWIEVVAPVDESFRWQVSSALGRVPERIRSALQKAGWRCALSDELLRGAPELHGLQPRGWPAGVSWSHVDAVHLPQRKTILVAQWRRSSQGQRVVTNRLPGALWHELGHAWDMYAWTESASKPNVLLFSSQHPEFLRAYRADVAGWNSQTRKQLAYYLQEGPAGPQEVFAEWFALLLGEGSDRNATFLFQTQFPRVSAAMRHWWDQCLCEEGPNR